MDINPATFSQSCFAVSKFMTTELKNTRRSSLALCKPVDAWVSFLAKEGGEKKTFQYCLNLYSSDKCLYFRAIQGHSGCTLVDLALQDNVLLPDDVAEYIYHIGNAFEMHSIIKSGLIPGGKSLGRDRQSVFFPAVNPMDEPRIAPYKHTWKAHRMKTGEELYCKVHQTPRLLRVILVPNSQHSRTDLPVTDSRKSHDCESEEHKHRETCSSSRVDFRIPGLPHSTVELVETNRKDTVRRLIEQFENHTNRNMLLKGFEKSEEINHFSQESKDLAIPRSSSSTRLLLRETAHAENACSLRKRIDC